MRRGAASTTAHTRVAGRDSSWASPPACCSIDPSHPLADIRTSFRKTVAPCPEPPLPSVDVAGRAPPPPPARQLQPQPPAALLLSTQLIPSPGSSAAAAADSTSPLASLSALDRVLDGLIVGSSAASNSSSSSSRLGQQRSARAAQLTAALPAQAAPAAAGVGDVLCEADWEREAAAAAAAGQLLVVKVEPARLAGLAGRGHEAPARFQHHSGLPPHLGNGYAPHPELHAAHGYSRFTRNPGSGGASAGFGGAASFGLVGGGSSGGLLGMPGLAAMLGEHAGATGGLSSSLHSWFCGLAGSYASAAAAPPMRFLSLQSDSPRAKALCRRLGVSAGLCALLVEPGSGRKLLEVCGTKIQQQLPAGAARRAVRHAAQQRRMVLCCPNACTSTSLCMVRAAASATAATKHLHQLPADMHVSCLPACLPACSLNSAAVLCWC